MTQMTPDSFVESDDWSDLSRHLTLPDIDFGRLHAHRLDRIRQSLTKAEAAMCVLVSPISLRYAVDYRTYGLFQSHVPTTYLFMPVEGPTVIHGVYGPPSTGIEARPGRAISFFDGAYELADGARMLADDIVNFLREIGTDNRRVAVEYVNPSITKALMQRGIDVLDGVAISEEARIIKSGEELACMRWAIAVAELGIAKMKEVLKPGVSELQLWALLNYTNLANNGDWHDGRMLASGPRINPWFQEASDRRVNRVISSALIPT